MAAGAGDSDRAGFAVVRREGQGGTVGLSSHGRSDAGPALQPRRQARASHQPMAQRSGAQRPGWLVKPLPGAEHGRACGTDLTTQPIACGTTALMRSIVWAVPLVARPCHLPRWWSEAARSGWWAALSANAMLRIHGDRVSLLAALAAHWADQQLQIPTALKPVVQPIRRRPRPLR
ncbi:MAG: hypothetical protein ACKOPT_00615 [Cyanobium sp.]